MYLELGSSVLQDLHHLLRRKLLVLLRTGHLLQVHGDHGEALHQASLFCSNLVLSVP